MKERIGCKEQQLLSIPFDHVISDTLSTLSTLSCLYNKTCDTKADKENDMEKINHELAFAELVSYIEESRLDNSVAPVFKITDLVSEKDLGKTKTLKKTLVKQSLLPLH